LAATQIYETKKSKQLEVYQTRLLDAWASCGSPHDAQFTWDMSENDNKDMNGAKPKHRFDRIFVRPAQNGNVVRPQIFTLIGKQRLNCERFASDHWGIWLEFSFD
jgi:tyrosyl-DNA phosphodiesterase 2